MSTFRTLLAVGAVAVLGCRASGSAAQDDQFQRRARSVLGLQELQKVRCYNWPNMKGLQVYQRGDSSGSYGATEHIVSPWTTGFVLEPQPLICAGFMETARIHECVKPTGNEDAKLKWEAAEAFYNANFENPSCG